MSSSEVLPSLFIVGAAKSGTTALHAALDSLDGICMSSPKEPFFFEAEYERGPSYYLQRYFAHWRGEPVLGEARHRNLYLPHIPHRIRDFNPDASIVAILRNPSMRAYSHWFHHHSRGVEPLDFASAVEHDLQRLGRGLTMSTVSEQRRHARMVLDPPPGMDEGQGLYRTYVDSGYYAEQLARYFELFPRDRIHVMFLEEVSAGSSGEYRDLVRALTGRDVDPPAFHVRNVAVDRGARESLVGRSLLKIRPWTPEPIARAIRPAARWVLRSGTTTDRDELLGDAEIAPVIRRLDDHYAERNQALSDLLGRPLPW